MKSKHYDLEDRLIDFGVRMIEISETVDRKREAARYLSSQLIRSGTSPGIHYGEAQAAESRKEKRSKSLMSKKLNQFHGFSVSLLFGLKLFL